jgi:hypothetical protein
VAAANLHAFNYGLHGTQDLDHYVKVASAVNVPPFAPKSNVKVQLTDNDPPPQAETVGKWSIHTVSYEFHESDGYVQMRTISKAQLPGSLHRHLWLDSALNLWSSKRMMIPITISTS